MDFGGRKRGRQDGRNGAPKRSREEMESFTPGVGSKSKPCMKFFSTSGCPFGEGCHFSHYVPGFRATNPSTNTPSGPFAPKPPMQPQPFTDGPIKTKLCNKINTPEGCKFGDSCRFAHTETQLNARPSFQPTQPNPMGYQNWFEPPPPALPSAASFGQSATAKISIDGTLAGAVIGKGGVNSKQICRLTGVKLSIKDHDSDQNQKNIELEGSFDQIKEASAMVRELIMNLGGAGGGGVNPARKSGGFQKGGGGNNFKTKMCENFAKGQCTFGERCHFAHGPDELRASAT